MDGFDRLLAHPRLNHAGWVDYQYLPSCDTGSRNVFNFRSKAIYRRICSALVRALDASQARAIYDSAMGWHPWHVLNGICL